MDDPSEMTRRALLARLPAAAAFLLAHEALASASAIASPSPPTAPLPVKDDFLIRGIHLRTAAPLAAMKGFYAGKLGFRVLDEGESAIRFAAGATELTFTRIDPAEIRGDGGRGNGEPFYHFAFNIAHDKLRAAREWQLERSPLVPPRSTLLDPAYPDDVWHFRHWNAHSVFFFDPAFNIVEYIARHDLRNDAADPKSFSTDDILYASEIGFVFDGAGQVAAARRVREMLGLEAYPRGTEPWWAMGDERGLVLCLGRKGELWAENTATPVKWDVFPTGANVRGATPGALDFPGLPYRVTVG